MAALRWIQRAGDLSDQRRKCFLTCCDIGCLFQQRPGVRMFRIFKDLIPRTQFHDPPQIHDRDAIRDMANNRQVMADEGIGQVQLFLEVKKEVDHLRLNGHIERRNGLIAHQELWFHCERPSDTDPFNLADQTVVVVGASSGIGAATARLTSELGANLILVSRSFDKLEGVRRTLPYPEKARLIAVDFLDKEALEKAFADTERVHHIIIPAVADENKKRGAFATLGEDTMRASFNKFWGQTFVVQTLANPMVHGGSVTLFASVAGRKPPVRIPAFLS